MWGQQTQRIRIARIELLSPGVESSAQDLTKSSLQHRLSVGKWLQ